MKFRTMEEKDLNEKESLELISKMISLTKRRLALGSGNFFLLWGYVAVITALVVYCLCLFTGQKVWYWLYFAIPIIGGIAHILMIRRAKGKESYAETYTSRAIHNFWAGIAGAIAAAIAYCLLDSELPICWSGLMVMSMLLMGLGTYSTGLLLKEKWIIICGMMSLMGGIGFLFDVLQGESVTAPWPIIFAVYCIFGLIIPGHIINYKARKEQI